MTSRRSSTPSPRARRLAFLAAPALATFAVVGSARAADPKCPPGSWFCADGEVKIGPEAPATPTAQPAPATPPPVTPAAPPPVVIYQPAPPPPVYAAPPPAYIPPPPPRDRRNESEVGVSVHIEGASFRANDTYRGNSSMGGIGASIRFRPTPRFALDVGIDAISGTDANGFHRNETPISALGFLYLNPESRVQVYFLGGFGFSTARVEVESRRGVVNDVSTEHYSYFGGLFGGGLELRVGRKTALNFDVRGFLRGRTDDAAAQTPEYTSLDGRTTNTSGGAIFTGGLTFYF